jgi:copper chaperone CopZ
MEAYRPILIVVTFGFLGAAFYFTYRPRHATAGADCCAPAAATTDCCAPKAAPTESCCATSSKTAKSRWNLMALNKAMLWVVTVLAVAFLFFPGYLVALIGSGGDAITADMQRSVLTLDGMTCEACAITATTAIKQAPGVLAVQVSYPKRQAAVGTRLGEPVPREQILASLEKVGYRGQFVDE